ncbi:MAG: PaaI family thioesterase [Pseudomonadota bacterium]
MTQTTIPNGSSKPQPDQQNGFGVTDIKTMKGLSGLELLRKVVSGDLPAPTMGRTLNFRMREVEHGRVLFVGTPGAEHMNPLGTVHGGYASTIMDSALGCAVHSTCDVGFGSTTIEFKVNLVRPIMPDTGEVFCEGKVVHAGRTIATSEATLKTKDGKLLAHGTQTCMKFRIGG